MGTEYYLVKPSKKELYYLGKHFSYIDGISINNPEYVEYECFKDFLLDIMDNNIEWLPDEYTFREILDMLYAIYEWMDAPIMLINDCTDDFKLYADYRETGTVLKDF